MTRNEQWHATFDLLHEEAVVSNASSMDELTEYLHQVGLGGEKETFGQILEKFEARSPWSTTEELVGALKLIYRGGDEEDAC